MEYVAGETLDVAFRHLAPAPLSRALPILQTLAGAIDASWASDIGHGALHPRDVFFRAGSDEVSITGFGVVPALEAVGFRPPARRPYAAPERGIGEPATLSADVYSLGAIAHELLTRRRPAGAGPQDGGLATAVSAAYRDAVGRVLSTALAARPGDRFPTASAFVSALAAIGDHATAPVPAVGPLFAQIDQIEQIDLPPQAAPVDGDPSVDVELTPVNVVENWETAFDRTEPLPVFKPQLIAESAADAAMSALAPTPAPVVADVPMERPPEIAATAKEWELRASAEAAPPPPDPAAVSRDRRPLPPALFSSIATETPPVAPFPWVALVAVAVAGVTLGGVTGYQFGIRRPLVPGFTSPPAAPATTDAKPPATAPAPATDAALPPASGAASPATKPPPVVSESAGSAATAATGRLAVRSVPSGSQLTVNGKSHGTTPQTLRDLPLGTFTVKVARSGYVSKTEQVVLSAAAPSADVTITLVTGRASGAGPSRSGASAATAAKTGSVLVDTRPQGAKVTVDGKAYGVTPLTVGALSVGRHTVRIELDGHQPIVASVTITAGTTQKLTRSLERR